MRKPFPILTLVLAVVLAASTHGCSSPPSYYYVANVGSDSANGQTPATAWQTIAHVNAQTFASGTAILFNGGQTFSGGVALTTSNAPSGGVTISSFGVGQAIISSGNSTACVSATNLPAIKVNNITCTGGGNTTSTTAGISIVNSQAGNTTLNGPTITNNTVSAYGSNGIEVVGSNGTSGFNTVNVSNNTVHDTTGNGGTETACIRVASAAGYGANNVHSNVTVAGNTVYNCTGRAGQTNWSGSGIVVSETSTATIANNVAHDFGINNSNYSGPVGIWTYDSTLITIQYNEAYNGQSNIGGGGGDGGGFDFDGGVTNSVMQYNWAHDNVGPGYLMDNYQDAQNLSWGNNTVRWNISQNNGFGELAFSFTRAATGSAYVYNNTLVNQGSGNGIAVRVTGSTTTILGTVANNIFAGASGTLIDNVLNTTSLHFTGNNYFTYRQQINITWNAISYTSFAAWQTATGQEKISGSNVGLTSNPSIYVPGGGFINAGYVPANLMAYNLQSGSPMIGAGLNLTTQFSINPGPVDYYGTSVSASSLPVGAANGDFGRFTATCTAATSYLARVSSFTKADNVQYNSLLCGLNSDGDLSKIDALWMLAAPNSAAYVQNLISTSFTLVSHGTAAVFSARVGIHGDGSSTYLDTGLSPPSTNYVQNSASLGIYDSTNQTTTGGCVPSAVGGKDATRSHSRIVPVCTVAKADMAVNEAFGNGYQVSTNGHSNHLFVAQRTGASAEIGYVDGVPRGTSTRASAAFSGAATIILMADNRNGSINSYMSDVFTMAFIGGSVNPAKVSRRFNAAAMAYGINQY